MSRIISSTKEENYEIHISTDSGHTIIADEPEALGGKNKGPSPDELIIAALAACTSATVNMYVQRKGWKLDAIHTEITTHRERPTDLPTIHRTITLEGDLTEEQRERILIIANKCPIHKMLSNPLEIETELLD